MTRLREIRKHRGITQVQLAEIIGVEQSTISQWETGRSQPSLKIAVKIANALGCKVDDLIKEE